MLDDSESIEGVVGHGRAAGAANHDQRAAGRGEVGEALQASRQVGEVMDGRDGGNEVVVRASGKAQVRTSPVIQVMSVEAVDRARSMMSASESMPVTSGIFAASRTASSPSPVPTSSAVRAVGGAASSTMS